MAFSSLTYTADGVAVDYAVTFDYLDRSHIAVLVDKVRTTAIGSNYTFEWINSSTVRVRTVATSAPVPAGIEVRIIRETPINVPAVVFGGGASLSSENLNKNSDYLTFALQEATDANDAFTKLYLGAFSASPSLDNNGDALQVGAIYFNTSDNTPYYWTGSVWNVGDIANLTNTYKIAAEAARDAAQASATAAGNSATAAAGSASAAAGSASAASTSADEAAASAATAVAAAGLDPTDYYTKVEADSLLAGKADTSHTHTIAQVTGLQAALDAAGIPPFEPVDLTAEAGATINFDLSQGNYFHLGDLNAQAMTFTVSNAGQSERFTVQFEGVAFPAPDNLDASLYSVATDIVDEVVTGLTVNGGGGLAFNATGTTGMYLAAQSSGDVLSIYSFTMSTPYTPSTFTGYTGFQALASGLVDSERYEGYKNLYVRPDGLELYYRKADTVYRHTLSTAWDADTVSNASVENVVPNGVTGLTITGFTFSPTGNKMLVATANTLREWNISPGWDLSDCTLTPADTAANPSTTVDFVLFSEDGLKIYFIEEIFNTTDFNYWVWTLGTPCDLSTVTTQTGPFVARMNGSNGLDRAWRAIAGNGAHFYSMDGDDIYHAELKENAMITWPVGTVNPPSAEWMDGVPYAYEFVTVDGGTTYKRTL